MPEAFRTFPSGDVAFFEEASGGGAVLDINSQRNRPARFPEDWLANLRLHADLDYFEIASEGEAIINHAAVAAGALPPDASIAFGWNATSTTHALLAHNLGYEPFALVAYDDNILWPGMPVQVQADGGGRYVTAYCSTTHVNLHEWASIGAGNLGAVSRTYRVLVFKAPPAPSGNVLFAFDPATGGVDMAFGKVNTLRKYLAVVTNGSPLGLSTGRTIDLQNGAMRAIRPDGTTYEPVPAGLTMSLPRPPGWPRVYGASLAYNGSYAGPTSIQVDAP